MAKKSSHSNSSATSAMAQLLAKHKSEFVTLKKGDTLIGSVTKLTKQEILIKTGAKTDAVVLEKDKRMLRTLLSLLHVGDKVNVTVLNPESDMGYPVVSLRRYLSDLAWEKLDVLIKSKEQITITVTESTKAGYVAATPFGVVGFLPHSHVAQQQEFGIGQDIQASVFELNREDNKIIFSQKKVLSEDDFASLMKQYKVGDKVKVTITTITSFGIFVSLPFVGKDKKEGVVEGFIHISEVSWDKVQDLTGLFTVGEEREAVITRFDTETKKINLSIKRLSGDPFDAVAEKFPLEKKVTGAVTIVDNSGVTVSLSDEVDGFIKKEKIPPTTTYAIGQTITVTVSEHDKRRRRIILVPVLLEKPIGYR
ncbi:MAG: S1 RNA-binding domain-containing protein [Patescibacteria group bacterium]